MSHNIIIKDMPITDPDALQLLSELNHTLAQITGASGASSFAPADVLHARAAFVVAYWHGKACGCGGLRPLTADTAEIKRVYARPNAAGVGTAIVQALEARAQALLYTELLLETRRVNTAAVAFYQKLGYTVCPNFGRYQGRADAVCMRKTL